jgi:hypothetical protein
MNTYEVSWQFEEGTKEWCDSFVYYAEDVKHLGKQLRQIKHDFESDQREDEEDAQMFVIFAQTLDDDDADADDRDITDELPEDILAN